MPKYTLSIPDDELAAMHDEHARTFETHRMPFAAWARAIWRAYVARVRSERQEPACTPLKARTAPR